MNAFFSGLQFLTTLRFVRNQTWDEVSLGASVKYFPLVGLLLGALWTGAWYVLQRMGIAPLVTAVLLMIIKVVLTGGLHFDGLMDTADGLCSWRSREQMLAIMKDSRVGGFGVLSAILLLLLNTALLTDMRLDLLWPALFVLPVVGRYAMVLAITQFSCARRDGIGIIFACNAGKSAFLIATFITVVICGILAYRFWLAWIIAVCCAWLLARVIAAKLGGLTGDTYGAITEMTETVWLLAVYCLAEQPLLLLFS